MISTRNKLFYFVLLLICSGICSGQGIDFMGGGLGKDISETKIEAFSEARARRNEAMAWRLALAKHNEAEALIKANSKEACAGLL